jgi:Domain of unknown function (DUF4407)
VGAIFIWLSGANRKILSQCPTERPKYFGLGAVILVTGAMAGVSLAFALVNGLKISLDAAIVFAVLWSLAITMIDRLFVVSMHRQRNPLIYLIQALPRLLMSVVLGFVISTPFVLQIFKPEITNEVSKMHAAARTAYFKALPTNPVQLTVLADQKTVNQLKTQAASGGPPVDVSADKQIQTWTAQLAHANAEVTKWTNLQNCQLYGGTSNGVKCQPGYGPVAKNDQTEITTWQKDVTTLQNEIKTRTHLLETQSQQANKSLKKTASAQLAAAESALKAAQKQLNLQTQTVTSGIANNDGILEQLKALGAATAGNFSLEMARLLLFLLFLFVDIMPVFIKLLMNLTPATNYDKLLASEEDMQLREAENGRAVEQAARRQAAQAQANGVRYRSDAMSAPLPGLREDIIKTRMRVEREWLKRYEAQQLSNVASGQGLAGIGTHPPVGNGPQNWAQGTSSRFQVTWPWSPNAHPTGPPAQHARGPSQATRASQARPTSQGSAMNAGSPTSRSGYRMPLWSPGPFRPSAAASAAPREASTIRSWLGSLRLPHTGRQRPGQAATSAQSATTPQTPVPPQSPQAQSPSAFTGTDSSATVPPRPSPTPWEASVTQSANTLRPEMNSFAGHQSAPADLIADALPPDAPEPGFAPFPTDEDYRSPRL